MVICQCAFFPVKAPYVSKLLLVLENLMHLHICLKMSEVQCRRSVQVNKYLASLKWMYVLPETDVGRIFLTTLNVFSQISN